MRATFRLLATAQKASSGNYLTPLAPTGLTGILTHPTPRPALLYLYNATLDKLATFPEHSAYRQSVESLTKHRLAIVEKQVPPGYEEWRKRIEVQLKNNPELFSAGHDAIQLSAAGQKFTLQNKTQVKDEREVEWDDDAAEERTEGPKAASENIASQAKELDAGRTSDQSPSTQVDLEEEPALTKTQVSDIENQIGGGLLEEVILVAQRELALVDKMKEAEVWEELAEKPVEGQWAYFERDTHTGGA